MGCKASKRPKWKKSKNSKNSTRSENSGTVSDRAMPAQVRRLRRPVEPSSNESISVPDSVTVTPMKAVFCRGGGFGVPLEDFTKINNNSKKTIAFKIVSTNPSVIMASPSSGFVPSGESVPVTLTWLNEEEMRDGYFRVFIAFSDTMPEEFKKEGAPKKHKGEYMIQILFSMEKPRQRKVVKPLPTGVVITPDVITFNCKQIGQPAESGFFIMNQSKRIVAFKILGKFGVNPAAGTVPAGKKKHISLTYKNDREDMPDQKLSVFIAHVNALNEQPAAYDGSQKLKVVFTKKEDDEEEEEEESSSRRRRLPAPRPRRKSMSTDDITIDDTILEEDEEA